MTREEAIQVIEDNRPTSGYQMLCEALDLAVKALRDQEDRRWIPVTERLPIKEEYPACIFNDAVQCEVHKCRNCGWNPVVSIRRKEAHNNG